MSMLLRSIPLGGLALAIGLAMHGNVRAQDHSRHQASPPPPAAIRRRRKRSGESSDIAAGMTVSDQSMQKLMPTAAKRPKERTAAIDEAAKERKPKAVVREVREIGRASSRIVSTTAAGPSPVSARFAPSRPSSSAAKSWKRRRSAGSNTRSRS